MASAEGLELQRKLNKAREAFVRYKKHLVANPKMKGQLEPILQGYQELIADLEKIQFGEGHGNKR